MCYMVRTCGFTYWGIAPKGVCMKEATATAAPVAATKPANVVAPQNGGFALAPEELTADALKALLMDTADVGENIRTLNRNLNRCIGPAVFRHTESEAEIRQQVESILQAVFSPKGVIQRGRAFNEGTTAKGETARGISIAIRNNEGELVDVNIRAGLDAITGNQENRRVANAVKFQAKNRRAMNG